MPQITQTEFNRGLMRAIYKTFYKEIVKNTPGKGIVADGWDVIEKNGQIMISNKEFGDIVLFLEKGTNSYIIKPKNAKALHFEIGGQEVFTKKVVHPGIEARKFIHEALNNSNNIKNFKMELTKEIEKLV